MKTSLAFAGSIAAGCAVLAGAAAAPGTGRLAIRPEPLPGRLVAAGQSFRLDYRLEAPGVAHPKGWLYVRNDRMRGFVRLPMTSRPRSILRAVVPPSLTRGHRLFYYALVRDPRTGRSVTAPSAGARAPTSAWVLSGAVVVRLGTHHFGHLRKPDAVVARARPEQVGWQLPPPGEGPSFGPQSFLVSRTGQVWLYDGINTRLLEWERGHPDTIARTVQLSPAYTWADSDFALGPADTVYVTIGLPRPPRIMLYQVSASGDLLWQTQIADPYDSVGANTFLRVGPDGRLYAVLGRPGSEGADRGWMPLATASGRPLAMAGQLRGNLWPFQPVASGLRLISEVYTRPGAEAPHEARFALVDRRDRVVRSWRVVSRTAINFDYATPEVVGGDPVVVLDVTAQRKGKFRWEYEVLRLGPQGARTRFALGHDVFGDNLFADVRVGPGANVYQLASSPASGVEIRRYSLGGGDG